MIRVVKIMLIYQNLVVVIQLIRLHINGLLWFTTYVLYTGLSEGLKIRGGGGTLPAPWLRQSKQNFDPKIRRHLKFLMGPEYIIKVAVCMHF